MENNQFMDTDMDKDIAILENEQKISLFMAL